MSIHFSDFQNPHKLVLIAGPCVIESEQLALDTAGTLKEITDYLQIPFVYKSRAAVSLD